MPLEEVEAMARNEHGKEVIPKKWPNERGEEVMRVWEEIIGLWAGRVNEGLVEMESVGEESSLEDGEGEGEGDWVELAGEDPNPKWRTVGKKFKWE